MKQNKSRQFTIAVAPDGELSFIYDDALAALIEEGDATTSRASYVEPAMGGWTADLAPVNGPVLGPFHLRQEALDAEREWLDEHLFS